MSRADPALLEAFVTVARLGTVGRAARSLGRSQPGISARLSSLELLWSTRLFRRGARGMILTAEGARLLPHAENALHALQRLDGLAGLPLSDPQEVRVGAGDALGRELLPRALGRLVGERSELTVRLVEGPGTRLVEALRQGEIDLALAVITAPAIDAEDLETAALLESPVDLLLPPDHRLVGRGPVASSVLEREPVVSLHSDSEFRRQLERALASRGVTLRPAVEVGNLSLVRRFVAAGLGVAAVPAIAFGRRTGAPPVRRRRLRGVPPVRYLRATRSGAALTAATTRLVELLVQEAGRAGPP